MQAASQHIERICIVGPGKLGASLALRQAENAPGSVAAFVHPRPAKLENTLPGPLRSIPTFQSPDAALESTEFDSLILCIGDMQLPAVISAMVHLGKRLQDKLVIHCTGSVGREILLPLQQHCEANVAAAHPFQTFADCNSTDAFSGIAWGVEAAEPQRPALQSWIKNLGGEAFFLDSSFPHMKALYHAAAVAASNALVANVSLAHALSEAAGIPSAKFLAPIMRQSLNNALAALESKAGPIDVLTGPIIRGDLATIKRHVGALGDQSSLRSAYIAAMQLTAATSLAQSAISPADYEAILNTLRNSDDT